MTGRQDSMQIATFSIGPSCYGLDICLIQEINNWDLITPAPLSRDYVQGVINLRGDIVTVIDQGKRLGISEVESSRRSGYTLMVDWEKECIGLRVAALGDVLSVSKDMIKPPPANLSESSGGFITGILTTDEQLVGLLDLQALLGAL